jgi:hypothetical protein
MKLYHGTAERYLKQILSKGIRPRKGNGDGNWEKYPSRSDMVYLTTAYPLYFATTAIKDDERGLILEVDTRHLNEKKLHPDEDFIAQVLSKHQNVSLDSVHKIVRDKLEQFKDMWRDSVENMGNCAHKGIIPPHAITRYILIDFTKRIELAMMAADPMISIINYTICKNKYINLVRWSFGDVDVIEDDFANFSENAIDSDLADLLAKRKKYWEERSADRSGIEVVKL